MTHVRTNILYHNSITVTVFILQNMIKSRFFLPFRHSHRSRIKKPLMRNNYVSMPVDDDGGIFFYSQLGKWNKKVFCLFIIITYFNSSAVKHLLKCLRFYTFYACKIIIHNLYIFYFPILSIQLNSIGLC